MYSDETVRNVFQMKQAASSPVMADLRNGW